MDINTLLMSYECENNAFVVVLTEKAVSVHFRTTFQFNSHFQISRLVCKRVEDGVKTPTTTAQLTLAVRIYFR